jgi:hypothetical protein
MRISARFARVREVQKYKIRKFLEGGFLEGNANTNPCSVLAPPSRARTSPFAGGSETSEAPYIN